MLGAMALDRATGGAARAGPGGAQSLREWATGFGERFGWQLCGGRDQWWHPDAQVCAATYLELFLTAPDGSSTAAAAAGAAAPRNASWVAATLRQLDAETAAVDSAAAGGPPVAAASWQPAVLEGPGRRWFWADALFMSMSVYARAAPAAALLDGGGGGGGGGNIDGSSGNSGGSGASGAARASRYLEAMAAGFDFAAGPEGYSLWAPSESLFYRDPPLGPPLNAWQRGSFWARGNGWAMGALAAALEFGGGAGAPGAEAYIHIHTYVRHFSALAHRLRGLQGADGCWRTNLTHPEFFDAPGALWRCVCVFVCVCVLWCVDVWMCVLSRPNSSTRSPPLPPLIIITLAPPNAQRRRARRCLRPAWPGACAAACWPPPTTHPPSTPRGAASRRASSRRRAPSAAASRPTGSRRPLRLTTRRRSAWGSF